MEKDYSQWDPFEGRIYNDEVGSNQFVTAATVAIFGTPHSKFNDAGVIEDTTLIGLIQDWNLNQSRQSPQIFECGSNGSYIVATSRTAGSMSMSRVIYNGSNLLYLLYSKQKELTRNSEREKDIAGYYNPETNQGFALNLASSLFLKPLGIILAIKSIDSHTTEGNAATRGVAAAFLENTMINSHGTGAQAGASYLGEQLNLSFEAIYPVSVNVGDEAWPKLA